MALTQRSDRQHDLRICHGYFGSLIPIRIRSGDSNGYPPHFRRLNFNGHQIKIINTRKQAREIKMAKRWYVLHVYSGFEDKVAEAIMDKAQKQGLEDHVEEVLVPTEEVVEVKRGQRVNAERKFFPGYVLARLDMNDEVWHLIKNTPKVTNFLGAGNRPVPISQREAESLIKQIQEGIERPRPSIVYDIGEEVKVSDGPFASFNGTVEEIDEERGKLKVSVSIFGRATPVELEYSQVEKI